MEHSQKSMHDGLATLEVSRHCIVPYPTRYRLSAQRPQLSLIGRVVPKHFKQYSASDIDVKSY